MPAWQMINVNTKHKYSVRKAPMCKKIFYFHIRSYKNQKVLKF